MAHRNSNASPFPHAQHDLCFALANFASVVAGDPQALGVTNADAATLTQLAANFDHAMQVAGDPGQRTADNIARKDAARDMALTTFRLIAGQIKANPNVAVEAKLRLGLKVDSDDLTGRNRPKKRHEAPTTAPILSHVGFAVARGHMFTYADSMRPDVRGRPHGAARLDLHAAVHALGEPVFDPAKAIIAIGGITRSPFYLPADLGIPPAAWEQLKAAAPVIAGAGAAGRGKAATLFGRWVTRTELKGPWSLPVTVNAV